MVTLVLKVVGNNDNKKRKRTFIVLKDLTQMFVYSYVEVLFCLAVQFGSLECVSQSAYEYVWNHLYHLQSP